MSTTTESPFDDNMLEMLDRPWPSLTAEDLSLSSGFKHRLLQEYIYRLWCKHTCLAVASRSPSAPERFSHSRESRHWLSLLSLGGNEVLDTQL